MTWRRRRCVVGHHLGETRIVPCPLPTTTTSLSAAMRVSARRSLHVVGGHGRRHLRWVRAVL